MTNKMRDLDLSPTRLDSLADYQPNSKVQLRLAPSKHIGREKSKQRASIHVDDSFRLAAQNNEKSLLPSKKKILSPHLSTGNQSRSPSRTHSIEYLDQDHHHLHARRPVFQPLDACDLRFFIIRHGERVDRYFGPNWFMMAFDQQGQYRPYHINLPPHLPTRTNHYFWAVDTPLTRDGLNAAQNVGRVLGLNQFEPTYAYSSPAMRCVLTTYQILIGLGLDKKMPIRIEPGLLELGAARFGMDVFLKPLEWRQYGLNIDLSYRPIMTDVPAIEREDGYYLRSKRVVRELEQRHSHSSTSPFNVLLVAHATSPETLTWDLVGRQPNGERSLHPVIRHRLSSDGHHRTQTTESSVVIETDASSINNTEMGLNVFSRREI